MTPSMCLVGSPAYSQSLNDGWTATGGPLTEPLALRVPGTVQHDMLDAGLLPDPFPGVDGEDNWKAACLADYTLCCEFTPDLPLEMPRVDLVFDGIDTIAAIELNGRPLGDADNMFRTWRFPVKDVLTNGTNRLRVTLKDPQAYIDRMAPRYEQETPLVKTTADKQFAIRKMPCSFGWDWGIRLPLSGLFRGVRLEAWSGARIKSVVHQTVSANDDEAVVHGWINMDTTVKVDQRVTVCLERDGRGVRWERTVPERTDSIPFKLTVPRPDLWWPTGLGAQPLYTLRVTVGAVDHAWESRWEGRVGLRTIDVVREPDAYGESFYFKVNGVPVFLKGANWVPADAVYSRLTRDDYRRLLQAARDCNHNTVRVWGGGMYEHDLFYDLCDEMGLLVLQDLMFACARYPTNKAFIDSITQEVEDNVARLQHHACLALWAGNNECHGAVYAWVEEPYPDDQARDYDLLFDYLLAGVVRAHDPTRVYWPGSDYTPFSSVPRREDAGDTHRWIAWFSDEPFEAQLRYHDRMVTEFGFQSFPDIHTVGRYAAAEDRDFASEVMMFHQRAGEKANARITRTVDSRYGLSDDFARSLIRSQVAQAEAIQMAAEHWRRHSGDRRCMGAVYWQLNDNWPVTSWSGIDYFGRWKALQYASRRFFAPVLLSLHVEDDTLTIHVVNDTRTAVTGRVHWWFATYDGTVTAEQAVLSCETPAAGTQRVLEQPLETFLRGRSPADGYVAAELRGADDLVLARASRLLTFSKHAAFVDPQVRIQVSGTQLALTAGGFAHAVHIDSGDPDWQPSDNFFDLLPGETRKVDFLPVRRADAANPDPDKVRVYTLWNR